MNKHNSPLSGIGLLGVAALLGNGWGINSFPRSYRGVRQTSDAIPRDDAFYIARAKERRERRAAKRAENQRRTEAGKLLALAH